MAEIELYLTEVQKAGGIVYDERAQEAYRNAGTRLYYTHALANKVPLIIAPANDVDYADVSSIRCERSLDRAMRLTRFPIQGIRQTSSAPSDTRCAARSGPFVCMLRHAGGLRHGSLIAAVAILAARGHQQEDRPVMPNHAIATALPERIERHPGATEHVAFAS